MHGLLSVTKMLTFFFFKTGK